MKLEQGTTLSTNGASSQLLSSTSTLERDKLAENIGSTARIWAGVGNECHVEWNNDQSDTNVKNNSCVYNNIPFRSKSGGTSGSDLAAPKAPKTFTKLMTWPELFWSEAISKVKEEKPKVYDGHKVILSQKAEENKGKLPNVEDLAEEVLDVAQKEKHTMELNRWSLPIKIKNRDVSIREKLDGIIGFAKAIENKAQPLIDLDPTGYAKLVWIPLCLVLDVSILAVFHGRVLDGGI